jgi:hypothetical protein
VHFGLDGARQTTRQVHPDSVRGHVDGIAWNAKANRPSVAKLAGQFKGGVIF